MGIYIKDMEMPTGDNNITLFLYPDGKVVVCGMLGPLSYYEAIPVPEHGWLCNKDDVLKVIDNLIGRTASKEAHEVLKWAKDCLSVLPTIIPAEVDNE